MAEVRFNQVRKAFSQSVAVKSLSLSVASGEFVSLLGPSGCGKTTTLRMLAGLEFPTSGEIRIGSTVVNDMPPGQRDIAMVFQSYALYPHMSVDQNLRFGLENQKLTQVEISARVARAAEILRIGHLLARRPNQLSGGQSQRVAIGRAIVKEPQAFLFDEPLSNLDAELRVSMRGEIIALHRRLESTMIYVTHDQVEAMTMADQIVVLNEGRIEQVGSPVELYARPRNVFVARFLGAPPMNILKGTLRRDGPELGVDFGGGTVVPIAGRQVNLEEGAPVTLGIRPEHVEPGEGPLHIEVGNVEVLGSGTIVHGLAQSGQNFALALRGISAVRTGERLGVRLPAPFIHLFDESGQAVGALNDWRKDYVTGST